MLDSLVAFAQYAWTALADAVIALIIPTAFFVALALIMKRKEAWDAAKRAAHEARINLGYYFLDALFVLPVLGIVTLAVGVFMQNARLILVPEPGERWLAATSALAEVVPLIAVQPGGRARDADVSRLSARLRDRSCTLLVAEGGSQSAVEWPQSEGSIRLHDQHWHGIGEGWGLIEGSTATVTARTRRSPAPSSVRVRLPGSHGAVEAVLPELAALPPLREDAPPASADTGYWAVAG